MRLYTVQGGRHGPGGETALQSFGDEAKLAIGCVVDQRGDSKEAAEVRLVDNIGTSKNFVPRLLF